MKTAACKLCGQLFYFSLYLQQVPETTPETEEAAGQAKEVKDTVAMPSLRTWAVEHGIDR